MDKEKVFNFIFNGGLAYCIDYIDRWGSISSLTRNISQYDIEGDSKSDIDVNHIMDMITRKSYAPYFLVRKKGQFKYDASYLWTLNSGGTDERSAAREAMQSNSLWFFTILKILDPKQFLIKTGERGNSLRSVKQVKEIASTIKWHIESGSNYGRSNIDDVYIRVKKNTSSILLYVIYKEDWQEAKKYMDLAGLEYKILNVKDYL